nr:hypothetical protein [Mesorhizobium sp. LNHC220B00]
MIKVLKPFNTRVQRFAAGSEVADDADLSPHTVEGLTGQNFLEKPAKPAKSKPAE